MFENSNNSHRERQSINRCESQDVCSPPWIKDLIGSKREKLVDIVNCANSGDESQTHFESKSEKFAKSCVRQELTNSELNISYISSKSGSTSIGSTSTSPTVNLPNAGAQALNECQSCHSCQHLRRDVPSQCDRESGFDIKTEAKAVHLHSAGSRVNVPIVRSVSSSVITGRPFSGCGSHCIVSCVDCCLERLQSISQFIPNDSSNKCHQNSNAVHHKSCTSRVTDSNSEEQITPGLVAQRKIEILQRQVSDSSLFTHSCLICGKTDALNNENFWNNLVKNKMICEKNRDKSDYNERNANEKNGHHYEEIMDYKRIPFVNTCEKHCKVTNGVESEDRDDEYDFKYGPGIVDRLKHKFMSISVQQSNYKLKRCSSLENILVDSRHNQSLPSHVSRSSPSQANDLLLPLLGKNGTISVRSITDAGNRSNGSQLSHRLYIQHHNNKNLYNSKSSAIVPLIKRAKSMETLLLQDDKEKDRGRPPINCASNQLISKRETPISNQKIDLQLNDSVLICDKTVSHKRHISANTALSQTTSKMKSVSQLSNGITDELPKPDTVKTYKRIFEPTGAKTVPENVKSVVNNVNNKSKNNYKKSQLNGSATAVNVKRKPPVLRATNKSAALKTQTSVNSSPAIKSESPLPQVIETMPSPTRSTVPSVVGQNDKNNNSNDLNKSANSCNTSNSTVRKPPIAPKRASLTLKPNPLTGMTGMSAAINKNNKINGSISNTNALKKVQKIANNLSISSDNKSIEKTLKPKVNDSLNSKTPLAVSGKKESSDICSNTQINGKSEPLDCCESSTNKSKVIKPIANIKPFTQNNQINGDSKTQVILNDCHQSIDSQQNDNDLGHNKTNETSIADKSETQLDESLDSNNKLINNNNNKSNNIRDNETNGNVLESLLISNLNCNTNANKESNDEISSVAVNNVNDENVSPNTCDIVVAKSRVNDPDSHFNEPRVEDLSMHSQQTVDVLKPSLLLNSETNHPSKTASSLWSQQNKKTINSSTTTIVFDFRGKDVKSNLAIHPLPFGVTAPKRLTGSSNGSVNDSDDDENYSGSTDIPLPSGIIFMGENIIVGKGSLLLTRNKKLSIQFNDSAIETFEYPSEVYLSTEVVNSELTNRESVISESSSRITTLKGLGVSQGRLGSYKPNVIETPFELGVSRVETSNSDTVIETDNEMDESDVVKPANPDETSSWSTSSTASDLLF